MDRKSRRVRVGDTRKLTPVERLCRMRSRSRYRESISFAHFLEARDARLRMGITRCYSRRMQNRIEGQGIAPLGNERLALPRRRTFRSATIAPESTKPFPFALSNAVLPRHKCRSRGGLR